MADDGNDDRTPTISGADIFDIEEERNRRAAETEPPVSASPANLLRNFRPLGHYRSRFYFLTAKDFQFLSFSANQLGQKPNILTLAPLQDWEAYVNPEDSRASGLGAKRVELIVNLLIQLCRGEGVFRPEQLRGRGVWTDEDRLVVHCGDKLLVDGVETQLADLQSRFVYEAAPALPLSLEDPLSNAETKQILDFFRFLRWEHDIHATLIAGWTVVALICGALRWRPHMWLTGPSGCGKSWALQAIQRLLGGFCLAAKGESSEAGLRQAMGADALPVTHDEAEGEDERTARNMDRLLGLIRQSSADVDGRILKGGQDGNAVGYNFRSAFLLSAIRVPLEQRADESRFSVVTLRAHGKDDQVRFNQKLRPLAYAIGTEDFARRFRARVILGLPVLLRNIEIFATVASDVFTNSRIADQLAPMLAGAVFLQRDDVISPQFARNLIVKQDWADQVEKEVETDEDKLLAAILQSSVNLQSERGRHDITIGKLIDIACHGGHPVILQSKANERLSHFGMQVRDGELWVANTNLELSNLLRRTAFGKGWARILKRIPCAKSSENSLRICRGGPKSRVIMIPIDIILHD